MTVTLDETRSAIDPGPVDRSVASGGTGVPPGRPRTLGGPRFAGSVGAVILLWTSFWPTLMPRTAISQGAISGISLAFGYGVFTLVAVAVFRALDRRAIEIADSAKRIAWAALGVVAVAVAVVGGVWMWRRWQNQQRDMLAMDHLGVLAPVPMLIVAAIVAALLVVVSRLLARGVRRIHRFVGRFVSPITSVVLTSVIVVIVTWVLFTGVVVDVFRSWANTTFGAVDDGTADGVERPASPTVSGSPDSLVEWDSLGFQGRTFVASATDAATLAEFQTAIDGDAEVLDPVRVYAGIDSADDVGERADLAVAELERTGGFDRAVLVVATATGTGWIDPDAATAVELMHGGDTAIVSMQYSFLPSWIAFLVDEPVAADAGAALFEAVYDRWAELPEGDRPKLVIFGLSLGSFGAEAAFAGQLADSSIANMEARTDGVLLAGPTHNNVVRSQIADERGAGSPVWQPTFDDGDVMRWFTSADEMIPLDPEWEEPRLVYVGHASDPVRAWDWSQMWRAPEWTDQPRGPDVPRGGPWVPFVTWTQSVFDLMAGFGAPAGHGHDYRLAWPGAWAQVMPPSGWSADDTRSLVDFVDARFAAAADGSEG